MKAIFAGSFDPPTLGHLDVIEAAAPLFEKLYIVIATNTSKNSLLDHKQRTEIFSKLIQDSPYKNRCEVLSSNGLVADLCAQLKVKYLIRGIRSGADLEREFPMSVANELLAKGVKTILIPSTKEHSFVSSTLVREIHQLGGDICHFVSPAVVKFLKKGKKK